MRDTTIHNEDAAAAVAAYFAASDAALTASRELHAAWRNHFESGAASPSLELLAKVAALQTASADALDRARMTTVLVSPAEMVSQTEAPPLEPPEPLAEPTMHRTRRKRRRESKVLRAVGSSGQKVLRVLLFALLGIAVLGAGASGISLALEIAGILGLIENPTRLPMGLQVVFFSFCVALVLGLRKLLRAVQRALYGSQELRPKRFIL